MRIEEVRDYASLAALRGPWSDLSARLSDESPYLTPEFLLPWTRRVQHRYRCRVLTAWDGERLIGLAPLFERSLRKFGVPFVVRSFPVYGSTPPFDLLVSERREAVIEEFVGFWKRSAPWDLIHLLNVRSDSPTASLLRGAVEGTGLRLQVRESQRTYFVPVVAPWEAFLTSRKKKFRQDLRRKRLICEAMGPARFLHYPADGLAFDAAMDTAFGIIDASWKHPGEDRAEWERFFLDLATELRSAGLFSIRFLVVGERPVAYLFEIDYRRNLHAFHIAYDLDYQRASPGTLILADAVRDAHERRCGRYDFGGSERFLRHWAESTFSFDELCVVNASWASRLKTAGFLRLHERRRARAKKRTEQRKNVRKEGQRSPSEVEDEGKADS